VPKDQEISARTRKTISNKALRTSSTIEVKMAADGDFDTDPPHAWKKDSIEERSFGAGLICLEGHYTQSPVMGPSTTAKVMAVISRTLEKTHTFKDVRYVALFIIYLNHADRGTAVNCFRGT
jgi:hypothetical protein